jgi:hypothetical protein
LYNGLLEVNVTDKTGGAVCSFTAFVNAADTEKPVAVVEIQGGATATPSLEWVPEGGSKGVFQKKTASERTLLLVARYIDDKTARRLTRTGSGQKSIIMNKPACVS